MGTKSLTLVGDVVHATMDETSADLDSHANQCILGSKTLVVYDYENL
jgi:hypothetical protein